MDFEQKKGRKCLKPKSDVKLNPFYIYIKQFAIITSLFFAFGCFIDYLFVRTKGQLISKCPFGVTKSNKRPTKVL